MDPLAFRNTAAADLFTAAGNLAGANLARNRERKADAEFRARQDALGVELDRKYEEAVRRAAVTGDELPVSMQKKVPIDNQIGHLAIKVVAIRELRKYQPKHPLVCMGSVRERIAREALKRYNAAGRPDFSEQYEMADLAPSDAVAVSIFASQAGS